MADKAPAPPVAEVEQFNKGKLKPTKTEVKNVLPTAE